VAALRADGGAVRKYGEQYGFDPLMLAAQGYQESQLDQNAKSHVADRRDADSCRPPAPS